MTIFLIMFGFSANQFAGALDDVDWNDWIVYEVDSSEATLYLDEEIGYTIYVDDTYVCEEVDAEVYYGGIDYYEQNCDPYYDFDNWMQIGDIYNEYSGEHQISVTADRFIVVDWTTVEGNSFENTLIGGMGCLASICILILGAILALVLKEKPEVNLSHTYSEDSLEYRK